MSKAADSRAVKREYYADSVYIDGNTVRRQERAPEVEERRKEKSREEIRRERERQLAARRNLERALSLNRGYVVFLTAATVVCFLICLTFIHLQADITARMSLISGMETELSDQRAANDLVESRLETAMTLDEVKARADELGLVYPTTSQIQYFTVENSDYMNQYTDVASR